MQYINLDVVEMVDYLTYLKQFYKLDKLSPRRLYDKQYKQYVLAQHAIGINHIPIDTSTNYMTT